MKKVKQSYGDALATGNPYGEVATEKSDLLAELSEAKVTADGGFLMPDMDRHTFVLHLVLVPAE